MRPSPLVPDDADLRDFDFMPLQVARLRDSEVASLPDGEAFRANVMSWCVAWHQVPAGSLPADDVSLARLLGYGRDLKTWQKVRAAGGLRHWIEADDGRLYHALVAEKVMEAWIEKLLQRRASAAGNNKRWGTKFDAKATDQQILIAVDFLTALNPQSRTLSKKRLRMAIGSPLGTDPASLGDTPGDNEPEASGLPVHSQGTGTVKGQGQGHSFKKEEFINSDSSKNAAREHLGTPFPSENAIEQARKIAPGYDMRFLEANFLKFNEGKNVRNPDAAFLGFVKKHKEANPI